MECTMRRSVLRVLGVLAFLASREAGAFDLVPSTGLQGQTLVGVLVSTSPLIPSGATITFTPAGYLVATGLRDRGDGFLVFDLAISPAAPPGVYAGGYSGPSGSFSNAAAFTVLAAPTPTPTQTPTPSPTATPTPAPTTTSTPTPTPTSTPTPGPTGTPTSTPTPGPTGTPTPGPPPTGAFLIAPNQITEGAQKARFVIAGEGFGTGTEVVPPPDVRLDGLNVLSTDRLEVFFSTAPGTPSGPRVIFVRTGGGSRVALATGSVVITVLPISYIGASVSVTTAAIVHPSSGSFLGTGDVVHARGLLAVTGTGPIRGSWSLDGVPYETFEVHANGGGLPLQVESRVPVPIGEDGEHTLELNVERPQLMTARIALTRVPRSAARMRLVEPVDGAVVGAARRFRWTLVPGAQAYDVVVSDEGRTPPESRRHRAVGAEWSPSEREWAELRSLARGAGGRLSWKVVPVFPGGVAGSASVAGAIVFVPDELAWKPGLTAHAGAGGAVEVEFEPAGPGLLHRLVLRDARGRAVGAALTAEGRYRATQLRVPRLPDAEQVVVEALAPGGAVLGRAGPVVLPSFALTSRRKEPGAVGDVEVLPPSLARVVSAQPVVSARWDVPVAATDVALLLDGVDVTDVSRVTATSIEYAALLPLSGGRRTARVRVGRMEREWTFDVARAEETPVPGLGATSKAPLLDWRVEASGFVRLVSGGSVGQEDTGHATISSAGSLRGPGWSVDETVELAARHDFTTSSTAQTSRGIVVRGSVDAGSIRISTQVGFSPQDATERMQIQTTGLALGLGGLSVDTPIGKLSASGTFDDELDAAFSSTAGERQKIRMFAWDAPLPADRFSFRALYLSVDDEGRPSTPLAPATGRTIGALGQWIASQTFRLQVEAAGSDTELPEISATDLEGFSLRVAAHGTLGRTGYSLTIHQTDADFRNLANQGLTPYAQPDKRGTDLTLNQPLGRVSAQLNYRFLQGGFSDGPAPEATAHAGGLGFAFALSPAIQAYAGVIGGLDRGDGGPGGTGVLPRLDRRQYGVRLTSSQVAGGLSFFEVLQSVRVDDRVFDVNDQDTLNAGLTIGGTAVPGVLSLAGSLVLNRIDSALGMRSDALTAFLQPTLSLPALRLVINPRAAYSRTKTGPSGGGQRIEQYQAAAYWSPLRFGSFEAVLSGSVEWARTLITGFVTASSADSGFGRRYTGTLAFRWGAGTGTAQAAPVPAPPAPAAPGTAAFAALARSQLLSDPLATATGLMAAVPGR